MNASMLLAGLLVQSVQAATPADYVAVIPLDTPGNSAAWQVELDSSVYAISADPGLRDLAVFNADGQAVPMIIWPVEFPASGSGQRSEVPVLPLPGGTRRTSEGDLHLVVERDAAGRLRSLEARSSNETAASLQTDEWLLDLGGFDDGIDVLELDWDEPRTGITARFEVAGSDNLQRWDVLNAGATLVVIEKDGARIERRQIDLPATRLRYLRLRRIDDGAPLLGMRAVARNFRPVPGLPPVQWLEAATVEELGGLQASVTRHLYTLNHAVPASEIWIDLSGVNALAQLDVSTSPDIADAPMRWTHPSRLVAFRLLQEDEEITNELLPIAPERRVRALRIDSATPLASHPHVVVGYRPARLLFLAEGRAPFQLAVGSATAKTPDYPVAAALASLRTTLGSDWQPPTALLGNPEPSAGASALQAPKVPVDWKRWLLWTVLIGAAAVVGGIALNLLRGAGKGRAEDRQQPPEE